MAESVTALSTRASQLLLRAHRTSRMLRLSAPAGRKWKSLWWSGASLLLGGLLSVGLLARVAPDVADLAALRIVSYGCWLFGLFGTWTLLDPHAVELDGMAALRGQSPARGPVVGLTMFRSLVPALLVLGLPPALFASLQGEGSAGWTLGVGLHVVLYLVTLGAFLSVVGALCAWWKPRAARWLALGLVLLPFFASLATEGFPNPVGFFVDWMSRIMGTAPHG